METENKQNKTFGKFNLFKLLQNAAVIGLFLVVGLIVLFTTNMLPRSITSIEFTIAVGLLFVGILLVLPWAKYLEQKEYKIVSLVFLIGTGVCVLLWLICTFVICGAIRHESANTGILHLIRITLIVSLQILIASFVGKFIIKYRNKYIPFQAITYLSLVYIDFWICTLVCGLIIKTNSVDYSQAVKDVVFTRGAVSFLVLALVYLITATTVITNARKRRVRNSILARNRKLNQDIGIMDMFDDEYGEEETEKKDTNNVEAQLEKIKSMLDKGLITKEEYDAKRKDIIDKM